MATIRICINPQGEFGPDQKDEVNYFVYDQSGDPYKISPAEMFRILNEEPEIYLETAIQDGKTKTVYECYSSVDNLPL